MLPRSLVVAWSAVLSIDPVFALEPKEVFIIANQQVAASREVAEHYCKKRGVPLENVIALDLPQTEDISRKDYNKRLVAPLREALKDKKDQAKVLLSVYGVPLRVGGQEPNEEERVKLKELDAELAPIRDQLKKAQDILKAIDGTHLVAGVATMFKQEKRAAADALQARMQPLENRRRYLAYAESQAAVDSELMLLWWDTYELRRWQVNLLYFQVPEEARKDKPPFMMTCRLDGPTPAIAKQLVDLSLEAEEKGLNGKVYVDARGIRFDPKSDTGTGYGGYDESMREMARLLEKQGKMTVVLDDRGELFKPDSCPDCALYCGWYSHANFIDSNRFVPGAIAWHLASSEAVSLRRPDVKFWCKNLLEKGAAATLGPVAEPYTVGFPKPAEFFGFVATGKYTLVESYSRSVMLCSWMGVLVGDPLYSPFAKNGQVKVEDVKPSPKEGRGFLMGKGKRE